MRHWISLVADVTCVITFVAVGRASHDENLGLPGLLGTAWPFLVGAIAAHLVVLHRRRDPASLPTGLLVWAATLGVGMLLRAVTGAGVQVSFVITTALVLAVLMLVWRGVHLLVKPGGKRPADGPAVPASRRVGRESPAPPANLSAAAPVGRCGRDPSARTPVRLRPPSRRRHGSAP